MCGIAGYISYHKSISIDMFKNMLSKTNHRGPDSSAVYQSKYSFLGHNRLKIIDLSDDANQPMHSHNDRFVIVFNGEIYNFNELINDLKQNDSTQFKTNGDTEILLELFSQEGIDCLNKLNGMFSIAILDKHTEELYLAVDRIGIKPLYYYWDNEQLVFSSELKNITALSHLQFDINRESVNLFLHLGYIPAPYTIYKNVYKLEPGNYLKLNKNNFSINQYWELGSKISDTVISDESTALKQLDELISTSVKYRLKSDVPYGVFLSGGIDSSLVAAKAASISQDKINTFTIGFTENKFNESVYSRKVANHLKTEHHEFIVSHKNAIDLIDSIVTCFDEPFADGSSLPTMLVSQMASKYSTVVLSGEGGDELFHGYGAYKWAERLSNPLVSLIKKPIAELLKILPNRYKRISTLFNYDSTSYLPAHIFSQEQYFFNESELSQLLIETNKLITLQTSFYKSNNLTAYNLSHLETRKLNNSEKQAIFDLQFTLPGDLLTKIDRATMKYSLEGRVPLLDHRIIEFALNLDPELKQRNGQSKYLLKKLLYQHVPQDYFNRPKQGFALPIKSWLRNELKYLIEENLNKQSIDSLGVFNFEYVDKITKSFYAGNDYLFNRLWALIIMQLWIKNVYKKIK